MSNVHGLILRARGILAEHSDTPALDAQLWMAHILGRSRTWVLAHGDEELNTTQEQAYQAGLQHITRGVPLPYLLEEWEFYSLKFYVNPAVLIPRPETEHLVESAMDWLQNHPACRKAIDIGTGSGCIAVSLAHCIPDLKITAVDISVEAMEIARRNALRHGVSERIEFIRNDLLLGIDDQFNLVCANLPYVPCQKIAHNPAGEPYLALDGGDDGLDIINKCLIQVPPYLMSEGLLLMEIEAGQAESVRSLAGRVFPQGEIEILKDLAGRDRILRIINKNG